MDNETIRLKHVLKSHLKAIMEADHLYWSETAHSREDVCEYQKRQARLKEIRLEIMTVDPEDPMVSEPESREQTVRELGSNKMQGEQV